MMTLDRKEIIHYAMLIASFVYFSYLLLFIIPVGLTQIDTGIILEVGWKDVTQWHLVGAIFFLLVLTNIVQTYVKAD